MIKYDEAADIDAAIKGDIGAKMRVEIVLPWADLLKNVKLDSQQQADEVLDKSVATIATLILLINSRMGGTSYGKELTEFFVTIFTERVLQQALKMGDMVDTLKVVNDLKKKMEGKQ